MRAGDVARRDVEVPGSSRPDASYRLPFFGGRDPVPVLPQAPLEHPPDGSGHTARQMPSSHGAVPRRHFVSSRAPPSGSCEGSTVVSRGAETAPEAGAPSASVGGDKARVPMAVVRRRRGRARHPAGNDVEQRRRASAPGETINPCVLARSALSFSGGHVSRTPPQRARRSQEVRLHVARGPGAAPG